MKKYVKPELLYERFELSQHIANCVWELKIPNTDIRSWGKDGECKAYPDQAFWGQGYNDTLFTSTISCDICDSQDICYQSGVDGLNVFAS